MVRQSDLGDAAENIQRLIKPWGEKDADATSIV